MFEEPIYVLEADQSHSATVRAIVEAALEAKGIRVDEASRRELRVDIEAFDFDMSSQADRVMTVELDMYVWCGDTAAVTSQRRIDVERIQAADQSGQQALDAAGLGGGIISIFTGGIGNLFVSAAQVAAAETQRQSEILAFEAVVYDALAEVAAEVQGAVDLQSSMRVQVADEESRP